MPSLLSLACPHPAVASFARTVLTRLLPPPLYGSRHNLACLLHTTTAFVWRRRGEVMTVKELMHQVKTADMRWLDGPVGRRRGRVDRFHHLKRVATACTLLVWVMSDVLVPLLRCCFHVTDTELGRQSLSYYPHAVWQAIAQRAMASLTTSPSPSLPPQFTRVTPPSLSSLPPRRLGLGHLRLRPRRSTLRPIINLTRPSHLPSPSPSSSPHFPHAFPGVNSALRSAFDVLTWERRRQPSLLGVSVFGLADVYERWREWKARLKEAGWGGGEVSVVCVDIEQCFDCIDRERLLRLLPRVLSEDGYALQRYSSMHAMLDSVYPRYYRHVYPSTSFPSFHSSALSLAATTRQRVYTDQVTRTFLSAQHLLDTVTAHVTRNVVQHRGELYEQRKGIPQGSVLSSLLCCLYLGHIERTHVLPALQRYEDKRKRRGRSTATSLLMRQMDDVLLLTTDRRLATAFLPALRSTLHKAGLQLNDSKTKTHFPIPPSSSTSSSSSPPPSPPSTWIPWNGLLIDAATQSIKADHSRYLQSPSLASHLCLPAMSPGHALARALVRFIQTRAHPLLLDVQVVGVEGVGRNWVGLFVVGAMKGLAWGKEMMRVRGGWVNEAVMLRGLERSVDYGWSCIRSRLNQVHGRGGGGGGGQEEKQGEGAAPAAAPVLCGRCVRQRCGVHRAFPFTSEQAAWLAYRAYAAVFMRKHSRHPRVLAALRNKVDQVDTHAWRRWRPASAGAVAAGRPCLCCERWELCCRLYDGWLKEHGPLIRQCRY